MCIYIRVCVCVYVRFLFLVVVLPFFLSHFLFSLFLYLLHRKCTQVSFCVLLSLNTMALAVMCECVYIVAHSTMHFDNYMSMNEMLKKQEKHREEKTASEFAFEKREESNDNREKTRRSFLFDFSERKKLLFSHNDVSVFWITMRKDTHTLADVGCYCIFLTPPCCVCVRQREGEENEK